jgi:pyruvate dehydrogenase complex dihydrolipoamide acetyltransferase long form
MPTDFKLPDLGENINSAEVLKVLVAPGDTVAKEQGLIEVETDKATIEVPCNIAGTVTAIHVKDGDTIAPGQVIVTLDAVDAPQVASPTPEPTAEPETKSEPVSEPQPHPPAAPVSVPAPASANANAKPGGSASPAIRRLARELGVDLASVACTDGRITREDVMAAASGKTPAKQHAISTPSSQQPATPATGLPATPDKPDNDSFGPVSRDRVTKIRQTIAKRMADSAATIPHVTNFDDADITELEAIRKDSKEDYAAQGIKLTSMPFIIKACATALREHPVVNASIDLEKREITYKQYVNIGIAVDTDRGLVVPVIRNADTMTVPDIARALMAVAQTARSNKFTLEDLSGGSFTISNLGAIGGTYSTPIINKPEVAILLVGRSRLLPAVMSDGNIEPRLLMPLSLSYDHRLVDGGAAARYLNAIKSLLEAPGRLLIAP